MRTITTSTTVYTLGELDESAQEKAIAGVAGKLGGDWWDSNDNDDVRDVMVWTLAEQLGTARGDDEAISDYSGIPDITVDGWDLDRGQILLLSGTLTRENAPALPWADGLDAIEIKSHRDYNTYACGSDTLTCEEVDAIGAGAVQAVRDAVHAAWKAGSDEAEYKAGEEYAREWIESNEAEFTVDGELYR